VQHFWLICLFIRSDFKENNEPEEIFILGQETLFLALETRGNGPIHVSEPI
jgi:hypothetical protein